MDYSNIKNKFFYGILVLAIVYIIFCVVEEDSINPNKEFAKKLAARLESVDELDENERGKIQDEIDKLLSKPTVVAKIAKNSFTSAIRGALAGGLIGGVEGALAGGIIFGTITPVIVMVESMI